MRRLYISLKNGNIGSYLPVCAVFVCIRTLRLQFNNNTEVLHFEFENSRVFVVEDLKY